MGSIESHNNYLLVTYYELGKVIKMSQDTGQDTAIIILISSTGYRAHTSLPPHPNAACAATDDSP